MRRCTRSLPWRAALALLAVLAAPAHAGTAESAAGDIGEAVSPAALEQAAWVQANGDTRGRPFIIVDKLAARVFAFDAGGKLVGGAPVLLGAARGDTSPPDIGTLPLAKITPAMRITPAGRYEAHLGVNLAGHHILWVDYDAALSLHPVVTSNPKEHRLERLATPSIVDNRISYGCINVPARFYEDVVAPLFAAANGLVYILPETAIPIIGVVRPTGRSAHSGTAGRPEITQTKAPSDHRSSSMFMTGVPRSAIGA